ncbi:MAG TPA: ROK family protein [Casimicrobiaceae bacterium]|jgi:glucokinase
MRRKCTLGIDIGATKTLLALFDEHLEPLDELKIKTAAAEGEKAFLANLESAVRTLRAAAREKRLDIAGAGIGIPGDVDVDRARILACPNIPFLPKSRLHERLAKWLQRPVVLGNDCHLALFGEHELGAARGFNDVIGIFLGSGIGGALLIGGNVHFGVSGCAGDLGHYLLQPIEPLAGADRQGFLDDFASRMALSSEAARMAAKQWAPYLQRETGTDVRDIRSSQLAKAIKHGDTRIEELVRVRMHAIGIVLSNFVDFLNPELVLLGGGLVEAMPRLVRSEIRKGIEDHTTPRASKAVRVVVSELKRHAVTTGAARLAQELPQRKGRCAVVRRVPTRD